MFVVWSARDTHCRGGHIGVTGASTSKLRLLLNFVNCGGRRARPSLAASVKDMTRLNGQRMDANVVVLGTGQCWKNLVSLILGSSPIIYIHTMHFVLLQSSFVTLTTSLLYKQMLLSFVFAIAALIVRFLTRRFIGEYGDIGMLPFTDWFMFIYKFFIIFVHFIITYTLVSLQSPFTITMLLWMDESKLWIYGMHRIHRWFSVSVNYST